MGDVIVNRIVRALSFAWLTGPIFGKEMRVSSRRRRNYVLRTLYIALFTLLLALIWAETMPYHSTAVFQSSRMAQAGQSIVVFVLWFEFITVQTVAIVMLSTSISDEIYKRTLGVLMTTPINSFQIVVGKLLSKLLQLGLLLGISLPLLAVVRVFGGVPWDYLVCGLCVTLTTALFAGTLSLFFSIFTRRAYSVIVLTIVTMGILFVVMPFVVGLYDTSRTSVPQLLSRLSYVNPYILIIMATDSLHSGTFRWAKIWPVHCGAMLGVSALLLLWSIVLVRRAALRQAMGQPGLWSGRRKGDLAEGRVRRVVGPPVLWKEFRIPLLGKRRLLNLVSGIVVVGLVVFTYVLCYARGLLGDREIHIMYVIVFFAVGTLFTAVLPATSIATEKESQTWTLLLTTSIGEWQILAGKFGGILRRCAPAWIPLFAHVTIFSIWGSIRPMAVFQLALVAGWVLIFLACTGMYFSWRFKHTTTAVIANMGLAAALWAVLPLILGIAMAASGLDSDVIEPYMDANPFVQAIVVAMATTRNGGSTYEWVQGGMSTAFDATLWILLTSLIYVAFGAALAAWAGLRMRRNLL